MTEAIHLVMKNKKVPKFCYYCGHPLKQEKFIYCYNENDGTPIYRIRVHCQNCSKKGNVVYFKQLWKVKNEE